MTETIKKKAFKKERSQYQFELFKSEQGHYYIEFSQTVDGNFLETKTLSFREAVIEKLTSILNEFQSDIEEHRGEQTIVKPTSPKAKKIIEYYFKNVSISEIALSLNLKESVVEKVLIEHKVPIVSTKPPFKKLYKRRHNR